MLLNKLSVYANRIYTEPINGIKMVDFYYFVIFIFYFGFFFSLLLIVKPLFVRIRIKTPSAE